MVNLKSILFGMFLIVLCVGGFVFAADTNGVWNDAADVRAGVFGGDEGLGSFGFVDDVEFNSNIVVEENLTVDVIKANATGNVVIQLG